MSSLQLTTKKHPEQTVAARTHTHTHIQLLSKGAAGARNIKLTKEACV
jgi:hypothetical protein